MLTHYKLWILITIVIVLTLSGCGLDLGGLLPDPEGDGSEQTDELTGPEKTASAEEGYGSVHYQYTMNHPDLEFKLDQVIPLVISEADGTGIWEVIGYEVITVEYRRAGGTEATRCDLNCQVILGLEAKGEIQLDPNTGQCFIPLSFKIYPRDDEWILDTDCPEKVSATFDCAGTSGVMADTSVYAFYPTDRKVILQDNSQVTLQAELKNLVMPPGVEGNCNW